MRYIKDNHLKREKELERQNQLSGYILVGLLTIAVVFCFYILGVLRRAAEL